MVATKKLIDEFEELVGDQCVMSHLYQLNIQNDKAYAPPLQSNKKRI